LATELTQSQFYEQDHRRRFSEERDYGFQWHSVGYQYRVAYFKATGEVVAICEPRGIYEVLGVVEHHRIEDAMRGWADAHETLDRNSLVWVRRLIANPG
jgi:hypothetical protein